MSQPLQGVRIADFSHVMAGPFASHFLAAMGAEVIKVEAPGRGDPMRDYGADKAWHGMSPGFIAANCGKKSIALDLKSGAGRRSGAAPDRIVRRGAGEFPARRDGAAGPRLRSGEEAAARDHLLLGLGLWADRAAARLSRDRQHRAGDQRPHQSQRRGGWTVHARWVSGGRHLHRHAGGAGDSRRRWSARARQARGRGSTWRCSTPLWC